MTPIERAARALCALEDLDPDANEIGASLPDHRNWHSFVDDVRAVIAAIRDPGNDIYQAGFDAEAAANPHKTQPHHVVPSVWAAMIDALLEHGPQPQI